MINKENDVVIFLGQIDTKNSTLAETISTDPKNETPFDIKKTYIRKYNFGEMYEFSTYMGIDQLNTCRRENMYDIAVVVGRTNDYIKLYGNKIGLVEYNIDEFNRLDIAPDTNKNNASVLKYAKTNDRLLVSQNGDNGISLIHNINEACRIYGIKKKQK